MIRCIAIDDEPMALEKLNSYISRIPYLELVASCEDATSASNILETEQIDAMFIDINMPDINGLEFVRELPSPPLTIFITAYSEYAVDSYKVRAVDYLLKPYGFEEFQSAASNLYSQWSLLNENRKCMSTTEDGVLYLKVDYRYIRVKIDDIVYIEGMNEYLKVKTVTGDSLLTHTTFRIMNESLPDYFLQVHRSYVVNMKHIREVERSIILMEDGTHISISDSNKEVFMQYLHRHSLKK